MSESNKGDGPLQFPDSRYLVDASEARRRMQFGMNSSNRKYFKFFAAIGAMMLAAAALSGTFQQ